MIARIAIMLDLEQMLRVSGRGRGYERRQHRLSADQPIKIIGDIKDGERVFDERRSLIFKTPQIIRFFDRKRNVLVFAAYSDRFIEGISKNRISSVPIMRDPCGSDRLLYSAGAIPRC